MLPRSNPAPAVQTVNSTATRNGILALAGDMVRPRRARPRRRPCEGDARGVRAGARRRHPHRRLLLRRRLLGQPPRERTPLADPVIHVAGNHEIEGGAGCFLSSNGVYWYPNNPATNGAFTTITWPTTDFSTTNPCFQVLH